MDPLHVPKRYIPRTLSKRDLGKQRAYLRKSRRLYKRGVFWQRPVVKTFKSKPSGHVANAEKKYGVDNVKPSAELVRKTRCKRNSLEKIVNKGRGAYYSSGSRPNQTAESWGLARLASAITGGPASKIDFGILESGCESNSPALSAAKRSAAKRSAALSETKRSAALSETKRSSLKRGGSHKWTSKYKKSINCNNPQGFSQKQYCKYGRMVKK
jgi:hypothetical protein